MKKRLPIIAVFVCAIAVFLVLLFMPEAEKAADRDNDGFPDEIDQCIDKPSKSNNGCPEEELPQAENKIDKDGDGYFLTNLEGEADPNDSDPCVPNENCLICDYDNDGLTLKEEIIKQTNPHSSDSDGDSIGDFMDLCPIDYGHVDNNGCKITLSLDLIADFNGVSWNPKLIEYAHYVRLKINGYLIPMFQQNSYPSSEIRNITNAKWTKLYLEYELIDSNSVVIEGANYIDYK